MARVGADEGRALEALVDTVDGGGLAAQRRAMAELERRVGPARELARELLAARLRRVDGRAAFALAVALARLGSGEGGGLEILLGRLGDSDPDTRWAAGKALGCIASAGDDVARGLAELLRSGTPVARRMALGCLADLAWPTAAGAAVTHVAGALASPDAALRVAALTRLVRGVPGGDALRDPVRALLERDEQLPVRRVAAVALAALDGVDPRDRPVLERCAADADPALARAARRALSRLAERTL